MMLANVVASGYQVSIGDAAITALLGYAVVFFGLVLLMIVVIIMGKVMMANAAEKKETPAAAPAAVPAPVVAPVAAPVAAAPSNVPAPGTGGEILLVDTTEKEAAMIMAIVANKLNKPLNELRFLSIKKEVK